MRILVPVDGSTNSLNAVSFIASRQTLLGSNPEIELLNIQLPLPARACRLVGQDAIQRYYEDEAEKVFEPARKILQKVGFTASESFVVGEAAPSISKAAEKTNADLVVMGSRGQSAIKGLFFGSVSNGVLAQSKCPMLVIRGKAPTESDALRVGIAVDGSKYGRAAVRYAIKHVSLFGAGATFYLINVVSDYAGAVMPDMAGMALPALSEEEVLDLQREEFNEAVEPLRPFFSKAAIKVKEVCLVGNPGDEISAFAKKRKLDMVVMGSHGYGRFKSAIMGSTATRIAASGDVPLLVIRQA
ncbi:universal stress protein [Sutterella sp.]|uniref:universal stress protein n=1 Tax=Sutterella sp. TaxID=1981025 RepID=UPI0026DF2F63|nr:universal stress protein [Sutterella sp.]MDO5531001.1 universal stress protein [Sutterella sp.]